MHDLGQIIIRFCLDQLRQWTQCFLVALLVVAR
jgi:hypothetical protein